MSNQDNTSSEESNQVNYHSSDTNQNNSYSSNTNLTEAQYMSELNTYNTKYAEIQMEKKKKNIGTLY